MVRKIGSFLLIVGLAVIVLAGTNSPQAVAQGGANAWASYELNMRSGPGSSYEAVTVLAANTGLVLEARNEDAAWLLGHTEDGAFRGWVASLYLTYQPGFSAFGLPISGEIVGGAPAAPSQPDNPPPPPAPGGANATATYQLNVRSGPGKSYATIGQLAAGTAVVPEARNVDASWILGHTQDGTLRGWMAGLYLRFDGMSALSLPVSGETVAGPGPVSPSPNVTYQDIPMGGYDPALIEGINLADYPVVAQSTGRARDIYLTGQALGNNPHTMTKAGDCSSEHWYFLSPFGWKKYNLGSYTNLQGVVDWFGESLAVDSEATHNGFNVNTVLAPEWANPAVCQPGESPLQCEFRLSKPSVAIIMFGTSDLLVMTPYEFDFYMRDIVRQSIDAGVIPVLSTFPGNLNFWNKTILYNQIVVRIALDNDIPLINLWLALEDLSNHGLEPDGFHLGNPLNDPGNLSGPNLATGYPLRNLVTLQSLDAIWRGAMR